MAELQARVLSEVQVWEIREDDGPPVLAVGFTAEVLVAGQSVIFHDYDTYETDYNPYDIANHFQIPVESAKAAIRALHKLGNDVIARYR